LAQAQKNCRKKSGSKHFVFSREHSQNINLGQKREFLLQKLDVDR